MIKLNLIEGWTLVNMQIWNQLQTKNINLVDSFSLVFLFLMWFGADISVSRGQTTFFCLKR